MNNEAYKWLELEKTATTSRPFQSETFKCVEKWAITCQIVISVFGIFYREIDAVWALLPGNMILNDWRQNILQRVPVLNTRRKQKCSYFLQN